MIFPQPLLIFICLALPAYFIYFLKRHLWAVAFVATVTIVDIFNSQTYMNLAAILLFGIVVIPHLWVNRSKLIKNKATWPFAAYFVLLVILGAYHGFLQPWPDVTGLRSVKDQAGMRTVLHLGRTFLEFCVMLYLVLQIERQPKETLKTYLKTVFFGSIALCVGAVLERVLEFDFYHFFTGGRAYIMTFRSRSLALEPRDLSQNLAHGILMLPFTPFGAWKYWMVIPFLIFGFYATFSFSGIVVLAVGVFTLAAYFVLQRREQLRKYKAKIAIGLILMLTGLGVGFNFLPAYPKEYLITHLGFLSAPSVTEKLEVYDAAAMNFLNQNPKYYLFGTGPGLIYLPATSYILPRDQEVFHGGFEALPHMGLVLILSNAGLVGLFLFLFGVYYAIARKRFVKSDYVVVSCILIGIYFFQIKNFYLFGLAGLIANEGGNANQEV